MMVVITAQTKRSVKKMITDEITTFRQVITKKGNSQYVLIPANILKFEGLIHGDEVIVKIVKINNDGEYINNKFD